MSVITNVKNILTDNQKASASFFYQLDDGSMSEAFSVDVVRDMSVGFNTEYTDMPLESGVNVSDHAITKPITLNMSVIISNTPLRVKELPTNLAVGLVGSMFDNTIANIALSEAVIKIKQDLINQNELLRSKLGLEKIEEIMTKCVPLQIYTAKRDYQNMVLTSVSLNDDVTTANALILSLSFKEIRLINIDDMRVTEILDISTPKEKTKKPTQKNVSKEVKSGAVAPKNKGVKEAKAVSKPKEKKGKSWAMQLFGG